MKNFLRLAAMSLWIAILILAGACSNHLAAQDRRIERIDSMITALHNDGKFNGNILIAEKGKPVYEKSFGYENILTRQPLSAASVFELASCSKQFTAFAIALLQHQGKLRTTDDITRFLPALAVYKGITIDNLLHHTSGLPDYMSLMDSLWDKHKIAANKDVIDMLARYKPAVEFSPGTKYDYSNTGYALLASVIEASSGMSYGAYLDRYIFKPLKMTHTLVYNRRYRPRKVDHYAYDFLYDAEKDRYLPIDSVPEANEVYFLDGISGDGTVNTTSGDLLLWDRALYTERLLPRKEMDVVFAPGKLNDGKAIDYAFGWMVYKEPDLGNITAHSGGWGGYRTYVERQVDKDRTIIMLQNTDRAILPVKSLRLLLEGKDPPAAPVHKEVKLDNAVLDRYTGVYQLAPDFQLTVTRQDNQLYAQGTGQGNIPIFPEAENKFFLKVTEAQLEFVQDASMVITKAILYQGGSATDAPKVK